MKSYEEVIYELRIKFPKIQIINKANSKLMIFIHWLIVILSFGFNKTFKKRFITTIGYTIYIPDDWTYYSDNSKITHLKHETIHIMQMEKYGRLMFYFLYLFFPFPIFFAYYRKKFEEEAYTITMIENAKHAGIDIFDDLVYKKSILDHFNTNEYIWTWIFKKDSENWYNKTVIEIKKKLVGD